MAGKVGVGSVVRVVLAGRRIRAFVTELLEQAAVPSPRPLSALVSPQPVFTPEVVELARWTARRYVAPLGLVLHDAVPGRFSLPDAGARVTAAHTQAPRPAWLGEGLESLIERGDLGWIAPPKGDEEDRGIAYAVDVARKRGARTLVVCPRVEVAERIASALEGSAVVHGSERPAERARAWAAAAEGRTHVVVGGRSALFVPLPGLGLVVVASAHDRSLKSERTPRLHGLQVARQRATAAGAAFVVSSPAPPLDLFGEGGLEARPTVRPPVRPEVARPRKGPVTPRLVEMVSWAVARGSDALVFAARKGGALRLRCRDCGWGPECPGCGGGTMPRNGSLWCGVCGKVTAVPDECGACGGALDARGWGHERVAAALSQSDLGAPVVRIVRGVVPAERPTPSVIVGTLAAAHAVKSAGCVCVADLDQLLVRPDFRASEHAIQTLYDLADVVSPGGRFLVQTRQPEHHVVQAFTRGSFAYFLRHELAFRRETSYPPFGAVVRIEGPEEALDDLSGHLGRAARVLVAPGARGRATALVRAPDLDSVIDVLHDLARSSAKTKIDVDPVDVL